MKNTSIINSESATEVARLILEDRVVHQVMGGFIPEGAGNRESILDIGCGPGCWVLDMARRFPTAQRVVGIDVSETMLTYARELVKIHALERRVHVECVDALEERFPFENGTFDLCHIRFGASFVPKGSWERLLSECLRIMRSQGIICLTESDDLGISSSDAHSQLSKFYLRMMHQRGYGFSPNGHSLGMAHVLAKLLQDVGCHLIGNRICMLDFSYGSQYYSAQCQNLQVFLQLLAPEITKMTAQGEYEQLYQQMTEEMQWSFFQGRTYFHTVWGKKP